QELRRGCWSDGYDHYGSKGHSRYADRVQVEILLIDDDLQQVLTRSERNVCLADPLEGVPVAGVGHADCSRHVLAVDLDVEGAGRGHAAGTQLDVVLGAGRYADRVQVEILLIGDDLQHVLTRSEKDGFLADPLEGVPVAGVGHAEGSRHVLAVDLDVERSVRGHAARTQLDVVLGAGRYADG